MAWGRQPMLPHVMRHGTDDSPGRGVQARCRAMEADGALSASVLVGFPSADTEYAGAGPGVVLDTGKVQIVVICNRVESRDLAAFSAVGIAPETQRCVMLKSRVHWRAGLKSLAHAVVECAGTGVCTSDYAALGSRKVRQPTCPLNAL